MTPANRWVWALAGALAATPVAALLALAVPQEREEFPHEEHRGLFPLCTGCHQGIESGVAAELYPAPASCASCHDGAPLARATFTPDVPRPDNLTFDHVVHVRAVSQAEESPLACGACHMEPGAPRMTVDPLEAERCVSCHEQPGADHFVDAECSQCHVPLAESRMPLARIAAIEVPADHEQGTFIRQTHGQRVTEETARCATCHTRERCVSCHVDADRPEIALLPSAPADMELPETVAHYPLPESHRAAGFRMGHGSLAEGGREGAVAGPEALPAGGASCATCHTRDDCASCHLPPFPDAVASLPPRASVLAPGVSLEASAPESHERPRFDRSHGTLAAADPASCTTCHTPPFCAQCHDAPERPVYHPTNFVTQHAADAWGRSQECATCHEVQVFCRSCHVQSGFEPQGRLNAGFHDAEPVWLLRHGQAARQSLESCASCHQQRDCVQCHSEVGAFKVNPHGSGFDARRAWERNPQICRACHVGSPLGGGG